MATSLNSYLKDIQAALDQHKIKRAETPEKGFLTAKEWAKQTGKADSTVRRWLDDLKCAGLMEKKDFRIKVGDMVRPVPHYKVKELSKRTK